MKDKAAACLRSVCRTEVRKDGVRDYLVQLSESDRNNPLFKKADWVILEKRFPGFNRQQDGYGEEISAVRVKARVHRCSGKNQLSAVQDGTIRIDQTLRIALGTMTLEDCKSVNGEPLSSSDLEEMNQVNVVPFNSRRSFKDRYMMFLHRLVGVQPLMMRVRYSIYSDMEIPVCRIKSSLFTILGVSEGEFVEISAIGKKENSENRVVVRVLDLDEAAIEKRQHEINQKSSFYPNVSEVLGLSLLQREEADLPWIFLDYERRNLLNVWPGDVVRVYRSSRHLLWKRALILAVPALVGITSWVLEAENVDSIWRAVLLGAALMFVPFIVVYQIRKEIM